MEFKIGQKVRILKSEDERIPIGSTGEIMKISDDQQVAVSIGELFYWRGFNEIELIK